MIRTTFSAVAATLTLATSLAAQTAMPFALDWKFEGPAAPYFVAVDKGYFEAEGLTVEVSEGAGSLDAIPKVATGAFPVGFADINSLMKFLDQNPGAPVIAAMMVYDKPPFAVVGRKSQGIETPADLAGKILGAPPPDGAWAQFPIFAAENGLDMADITVEPVGFPTREPMLAEGKVDSVTGFSFSASLNLIRLGVPEDDLTILLMADHGGGALRQRSHREHRLCRSQSRSCHRLSARDCDGLERCRRRAGCGDRGTDQAQPCSGCRSGKAPL